MQAVVWHGTEDVRVDEVPDPTIQEPSDAIVRITSTAICGSDLHLYRVLTMYMEPATSRARDHGSHRRAGRGRDRRVQGGRAVAGDLLHQLRCHHRRGAVATFWINA